MSLFPYSSVAHSLTKILTLQKEIMETRSLYVSPGDSLFEGVVFLRNYRTIGITMPIDIGCKEWLKGIIANEPNSVVIIPFCHPKEDFIGSGGVGKDQVLYLNELTPSLANVEQINVIYNYNSMEVLRPKGTTEFYKQVAETIGLDVTIVMIR